MATKGFNKAASNLRFLTGRGSMNGLAGYLQAYFGQVTSVARNNGAGTVLAASTTLVVADTSIIATDQVQAFAVAQGATPGTFVSAITITPGVGFTVTLNQAPGVGGYQFSYTVQRLVSHI